jgi:hypothetical protein
VYSLKDFFSLSLSSAIKIAFHIYYIANEKIVTGIGGS